jgi:hypothetical protein
MLVTLVIIMHGENLRRPWFLCSRRVVSIELVDLSYFN